MAAHILIIEDNPANMELMRYLLHASQYRVSTADTGEHGVTVAERDIPDLVLCDVQLPGIDGYEVVRRMRANPLLSPVPVVAVTALAMVGDREKALATFDGYMSKPIEPAVFLKQVETFLSPRHRNAAPSPPTANTGPMEAPAANGRTVLVVDNLQTNLELARSILEKFGYRVVTVSNPHEAIPLARETAPDIVLSDVCMPVGSGYDLIQKFKADAELRKIPFVFITSTAATESERHAGLALGAVKYLFRPIEPQELIQEIESCLAVSTD
jgi:two-component system cell cycle response regulator